METNLKGRVKWFNLFKGYGFINLTGTDADYFMYHKDVIDKDINEGDSVTFDEKEGNKGIVAKNVKRIIKN